MTHQSCAQAAILFKVTTSCLNISAIRNALMAHTLRTSNASLAATSVSLAQKLVVFNARAVTQIQTILSLMVMSALMCAHSVSMETMILHSVNHARVLVKVAMELQQTVFHAIKILSTSLLSQRQMNACLSVLSFTSLQPKKTTIFASNVMITVVLAKVQETSVSLAISLYS